MMTMQTIQSIGTPLFRKYGVKRAALFGSVVRGEAAKGSDVDLLIEMSDQGRPYDFFNLYADLTEQLGCPVDLVEYNALHPKLKPYVLADAVNLYQE